MAKYLYPAIFKPEEKGGYSVNFPDIESCYTQGDDLQDAYDMASDVLCLMLYNFEENKAAVPSASDPNDIKAQDGCFVSLVGADTMEYRRLYENKAVKKTLTLPQWLNTMAERENINFSQVLQDALRKRLKV